MRDIVFSLSLSAVCHNACEVFKIMLFNVGEHCALKDGYTSKLNFIH